MQQTQVVTAQPVQLQVPLQATPQSSRYSRAVKSLGILQIINAVVSVLLHAISWATGSALGFVAGPIWGGLCFYLPAGILGVLSVALSASSRRCLAIACMVMSILAAIIAFMNCGICIAAAAHEYPYVASYYLSAAPLVLDCILVIVSLAELIIAIVAAVYCCRIMNESSNMNTTTIQYVPSPGYPNMNMANQAVPPYAANTAAPAPMGQTYGSEKGNLA